MRGFERCDWMANPINASSLVLGFRDFLDATANWAEIVRNTEGNWIAARPIHTLRRKSISDGTQALDGPWETARFGIIFHECISDLSRLGRLNEATDQQPLMHLRA
jgi:hypothetical protein